MATTSSSIPDFAAQQAERARKERARLDELKERVLPPLRNAKIANLEIHFDGYGDSGAIEDKSAHNANGEVVDIPECSIPVSDRNDPLSLPEALDTLGYLALEIHHSGWEINEGAFGSLKVDVAEQTFMLECNIRYVDYDDHSTSL